MFPHYFHIANHMDNEKTTLKLKFSFTGQFRVLVEGETLSHVTLETDLNEPMSPKKHGKLTQRSHRTCPKPHCSLEERSRHTEVSGFHSERPGFHRKQSPDYSHLQVLVISKCLLYHHLAIYFLYACSVCP